MIQRISYLYAKYLFEKKIIYEHNIDVYVYGFELFFASILNITCILVISLAFFSPIAGISFLLGCIPLRTLGGGYHANAHRKCNLTSVFLFVTLEGLAFFIQDNFFPIIYVGLAICSLCTLYLWAPCEPINNPQTPERQKKNRKKSLILGVVNLILAILIFKFGTPNTWFTSYYIGVLFSTLLLCIGSVMHLEK